jgi:hypothetical protein
MHMFGTFDCVLHSLLVSSLNVALDSASKKPPDTKRHNHRHDPLVGDLGD